MATEFIARERSLTENEAIVIKSLLAGSSESGEDRIRESGLPRSTYRDAKRRIYASGILEDRYIPSAVAVGASKISFLVARPFTDRVLEAARALSEVPGTVLCWTSPQILFGVTFFQSEIASRTLIKAVQSGAFGAVVVSMEVDPAPAQIPVYFDFEGAWGHLAGLTGNSRYPRAIPHPRASSLENPVLHRPESSSLRQLLLRPLVGDGRRHEPHLFGPAALPRHQQRWIAQGLVDWRVLLSPQNPPAYRGASVAELMFVRGDLRPGCGPRSLLSELTEVCGVYPFLLVSDGVQVLLGSLATGRFGTSSDSHSVTTRAPVMSTLTVHIDNIECVRQPLSALRADVDHRYDRLAPDIGVSRLPPTRNQ
jgi:hypothetical protein